MRLFQGNHRSPGARVKLLGLAARVLKEGHTPGVQQGHRVCHECMTPPPSASPKSCGCPCVGDAFPPPIPSHHTRHAGTHHHGRRPSVYVCVEVVSSEVESGMVDEKREEGVNKCVCGVQKGSPPSPHHRCVMGGTGAPGGRKGHTHTYPPKAKRRRKRRRTMPPSSPWPGVGNAALLFLCLLPFPSSTSIPPHPPTHPTHATPATHPLSIHRQ